MPDVSACSGPRALCARCQRPVSACICAWVAPLDTRVELLILQHPMETNNAKGSARLLQLSVGRSVLAVGETFAPDALFLLLYAGSRSPVLLYPDLPGERALGLAAPPLLAAALLDNPASLRLVVLDGTWRKSRKMLYQNPLLQCLPRLALNDVPASHYLIRKAHAADQLSTLEASCYALAQLDGGMPAVQPLLDAFDRFVARFQATGGRIGT